MVIKSFRIDTEHKIEESLRAIAKQPHGIASSLALLAMTTFFDLLCVVVQGDFKYLCQMCRELFVLLA